MSRRKIAPVPAPVSTPASPRPVAPTAAPKLTRAMLAPRMMPTIHYEVTIGWDYLEHHLEREAEVGLDLNPDFQRGHVWTDAQRVAWLEYILLGGETGRVLLVGHVGDLRAVSDTSCVYDHYALIDGKQRLTTVRAFLRDEIRVFADTVPGGVVWSEMAHDLKRSGIAKFEWRRVMVDSRADLLRLYLRLNAGGTPHAPEEIERVRTLLALLAHEVTA